MTSIRTVMQKYVRGRMQDNEELRHGGCSDFTS